MPMVSQVWMCCFDKFSLAENILMDNHSKKNFILFMTVVCNSLLARQGCFTETDGGEANQHRAKLLMSIIDDSQFKGPSTQMHNLHKHKVS